MGFLIPQEFGGHSFYLFQPSHNEENIRAIVNQIYYTVSSTWGIFDVCESNKNSPRKYV